MRQIKEFGDKKIKIRARKEEDIKNAGKFQKYINELAEDPDAYISIKTKKSLKEEKKYLKESLEKVKKQEQVTLISEHKNKIISGAKISLGKEKPQKHIGYLGIAILRGYRGIGLGTYLLRELIKLAKKKLEPKPAILRLSVASVNQPAIALYKKTGFKEVARITEQLKYEGELCDEVIMLKYL